MYGEFGSSIYQFLALHRISEDRRHHIDIAENSEATTNNLFAVS